MYIKHFKIIQKSQKFIPNRHYSPSFQTCSHKDWPLPGRFEIIDSIFNNLWLKILTLLGIPLLFFNFCGFPKWYFRIPGKLSQREKKTSDFVSHLRRTVSHQIPARFVLTGWGKGKHSSLEDSWHLFLSIWGTCTLYEVNSDHALIVVMKIHY